MRKKQYFGTKADFEKLEKTVDSAVTLIKTHLDDRLKQIEAQGYSRLEMAAAYIILAYHALRHGYSQDRAEHALNILMHFAKKRIERNIASNNRKKPSLH